ncbi:hypothetical protein PMAYCL1PPCAC_11487, partial [Pristionchus mayeri]
MHNTEVSTYEFLQDFEGLMMPRMYFGKPFPAEERDGGLICLEYIGNSRTMSFHEEHEIGPLKQLAHTLGKIQACSLKKEPTALDLHNDLFKNMVDVWSLEAINGMFTGLVEFDNSNKTRELMANIGQLLDKYYGSNLPTTIHHQMGFRPVLVNGDLHGGNVLIDKKTGDLAAVIDWQCAHLGVGVEDLHQIILSSLSAQDRRSTLPQLIEIMYDSLVENLD